MKLNTFSEISKEIKDGMENSNIAKKVENIDIYKVDIKECDRVYEGENKEIKSDEIKSPIQNKKDGLRREREVESDLKEKYPVEKGYENISEAYLRDKDGKFVKDSETGEARRIDFIVVKDGKVIDSIEVTSETVDKTKQIAKENRIREQGGNYIKNNDGQLLEIPSDVKTRVERRS